MTDLYELLDSGDGEKLERFGNIIARRPSSVCIWKRRHNDLWSRAEVSYDPKAACWSSKRGLVQDLVWDSVFAGCKLRLRLQDNGQVGVFPEHASYLSKLADNFPSEQGRANRVLNLFAFIITTQENISLMYKSLKSVLKINNF